MIREYNSWLMKVDSIKNPAFEELRRCRTVAGRGQTFLIENEAMIEQALQAGFTLKAIYCTDKVNLKMAPVVHYEISQGMMSKVFGNETPQVVALAYKKQTALSAMIGKPLLLILDQIQNCNNMGMILRSAEAFGVGGVIVIPHPTADLYDRNAIKGSMGSFFRLPVCLSSIEEVVPFLKTHQIHLIGTALNAPLPLEKLSGKFPAALVVGNEAGGICQALMQCSDTLITIPMRGEIQSLNVVVAASICLYHLSGVSS
jgi:RNA methyltransferase, TrmH family